jgi:hypothetical protein
MAEKKIFDNMYISIFLCPRGCNCEGKSSLSKSWKDDFVRCKECGWWGWFKPYRVTVEDVNA